MNGESKIRRRQNINPDVRARRIIRDLRERNLDRNSAFIDLVDMYEGDNIDGETFIEYYDQAVIERQQRRERIERRNIPVAKEVPMAVEVQPIPNEEIPMARVVGLSVQEITRQQTS